MPNPLGQCGRSARSTEVGLVRVQCVDDAVERAQGASNSEDRAQRHSRVTMLKTTQRVP